MSVVPKEKQSRLDKLYKEGKKWPGGQGPINPGQSTMGLKDPPKEKGHSALVAEEKKKTSEYQNSKDYHGYEDGSPSGRAAMEKANSTKGSDQKKISAAQKQAKMYRDKYPGSEKEKLSDTSGILGARAENEKREKAKAEKEARQRNNGNS